MLLRIHFQKKKNRANKNKTRSSTSKILKNLKENKVHSKATSTDERSAISANALAVLYNSSASAGFWKPFGSSAFKPCEDETLRRLQMTTSTLHPGLTRFGDTWKFDIGTKISRASGEIKSKQPNYSTAGTAKTVAEPNHGRRTLIWGV